MLTRIAPILAVAYWVSVHSAQLGAQIPTLMAFRDGILVFSQPGALPAPALEQVIKAVQDLDMEEVRAEVAKQQAGGAGSDQDAAQ